MSTAPWQLEEELEASPPPYIAIPGDFTVHPPGLGFICVTPDGMNTYRIGVDADGTPVSWGLGSYSAPVSPVPTEYQYFESDCDLLFTTPGTGFILVPSALSSTWYRLRVDDDGALVSEGMAPVGWAALEESLMARLAVGNLVVLDQDVLIASVGSGIVMPTADGLHTYRMGVNADGSITTELVS